MQPRALWFTKSLQVDSRCLPLGLRLGVYLKAQKYGTAAVCVSVDFIHIQESALRELLYC